LCEVRIWDRVRSTDELNRDRFRVLDGDRPSDLRVRFPGDVLALEGGARVVRSSDGPPLLDAVAHAARRARFAHFAALAEKGNAAEGASVFATLCQQCHVKNGVGASVGPPLDGIHNRGLEGMLTAILEPSAAVESGYRVLRVELVDETAVEGLLVRSEDQTVTIRPVSATGALDPQTIPRDQIARLRWSKLSVMPEGLLESLSPEDAANLLAYTVSGTIHK
jgi:putative heme-binding domain-containing protein